MTPHPDECVHDKQVKHASGGIECVVCGRELVARPARGRSARPDVVRAEIKRAREALNAAADAVPALEDEVTDG